MWKRTMSVIAIFAGAIAVGLTSAPATQAAATKPAPAHCTTSSTGVLANVVAKKKQAVLINVTANGLAVATTGGVVTVSSTLTATVLDSVEVGTKTYSASSGVVSLPLSALKGTKGYVCGSVNIDPPPPSSTPTISCEPDPEVAGGNRLVYWIPPGSYLMSYNNTNRPQYVLQDEPVNTTTGLYDYEIFDATDAGATITGSLADATTGQLYFSFSFVVDATGSCPSTLP